MAQNRSSICWDCARSNALFGVVCSWFSGERRLPAGAVYEQRTVVRGSGRLKDELTVVYSVRECPLFLAESEEIRRKLRGRRLAEYDGEAGYERLAVAVGKDAFADYEAAYRSWVRYGSVKARERLASLERELRSGYMYVIMGIDAVAAMERVRCRVDAEEK